MHDQKILLEDSWRELFFANVAEANLIDNFDVLLCAYESLEKSDKTPTINKEIKLCEDILRRMKNLQIQAVEYRCLRSLILFKSGQTAGGGGGNELLSTNSGGSPCSSNDSKQLHDVQKIRNLFEAAESELKRFGNDDMGRYQSLTESLSHVKNVSSYTVKELFFRNIIGENSLITTLLSLLETRTYNGEVSSTQL